MCKDVMCACGIYVMWHSPGKAFFPLTPRPLGVWGAA